VRERKKEREKERKKERKKEKRVVCVGIHILLY